MNTESKKEQLLEKKQRLDYELRRVSQKDRDKKRTRKSVTNWLNSDTIEKIRTIHYHSRANKNFVVERAIDLLYEYLSAKEDLTPPPDGFTDWRDWDPMGIIGTPKGKKK